MLFSWSLLILSVACVPVNGEVRGHFKCIGRRSTSPAIIENDTPTTQPATAAKKSDAATTTTTTDAATTQVDTSNKVGKTNIQADTTVTKIVNVTSIKADTATTKAGTTHDSACLDNLTRADCKEIFQAGCTNSGIYTIQPAEWTGNPFAVYCNMTDLPVESGASGCKGGGWTVFQRRVNGSVDFYRTWNSYKEGFGLVDQEFWLGNDKLHHLTKQGRYELRIDLVSKFGNSYYACYGYFHIKDQTSSYSLEIKNPFSGTAGERMLGLNNLSFTTRMLTMTTKYMVIALFGITVLGGIGHAGLTQILTAVTLQRQQKEHFLERSTH